MLENLEKLYCQLEKEDIMVIKYPFARCKSVALEEEKVVGIDETCMGHATEEYTVLIHEKGHFDAGAFYKSEHPYAIREQAERRADRAAFLQYIPLQELKKCMKKGITPTWELAEFFGVT